MGLYQSYINGYMINFILYSLKGSCNITTVTFKKELMLLDLCNCSVCVALLRYAAPSAPFALCISCLLPLLSLFLPSPPSLSSHISSSIHCPSQLASYHSPLAITVCITLFIHTLIYHKGSTHTFVQMDEEEERYRMQQLVSHPC